jgi:hypothetical protein
MILFFTEANEGNEGRPSFSPLVWFNFQKFSNFSDLAGPPEDLHWAIQKNIPFVSFVSFCSNSQIRAGKDHAGNSINEFHFMEINDQPHGNIQQFHVAQ